MADKVGTGPLAGLRIVEFGGIGPGPYAAMLLADMGADVVRIERSAGPGFEYGYTLRSRRSVILDIKNADDRDAAIRLVAASDVLIEGFRPGVMERLRLGPADMAAVNPALIYARMTGWGQDGPRAHTAGHDINYIAITGALGAIGAPSGDIVPPLNLVGDYGGGALFLVVGILAAVLEARNSGQGQIVDAAICDGVTSMMGLFHQLLRDGRWIDRPAANMIDGGAHYYGAYECADGKHISVGAIEPQFYAILRDKAGLDDSAFDQQSDPALWPDLRARMAAIFRQRSRDEWVQIFDGTDACVAPVLSIAEARDDPHLTDRRAFIQVDGTTQPAPAPRFSRTPSAARPHAGPIDPAALLEEWRR